MKYKPGTICLFTYSSHYCDCILDGRPHRLKPVDDLGEFKGIVVAPTPFVNGVGIILQELPFSGWEDFETIDSIPDEVRFYIFLGSKDLRKYLITGKEVAKVFEK